MSLPLSCRLLFFSSILFLWFAHGEIVQRSSGEFGVLSESISQRSLDRPWRNMTNGLICESTQKSVSELWSYGSSQMLKTSNLNFTFPEDYPILITGIYVSWSVSINRKPYLGVRESKVSMFLPNRTGEISTKVRTYPTTVGDDGWQITESTISYPLINESAIWNLEGGINATDVSSPSFGFGLTVLNGATDTRAMVGCVLITVFYEFVIPTTTSPSTTTEELTTTTVNTNTSTNATAATTKKTKPTTHRKNTPAGVATTAAKKTIDETSGSGQAIIALTFFVVLFLCVLLCCSAFVYKQHKKWKMKWNRNKKTTQEYHALVDDKMQEMNKIRKNTVLENVEMDAQIGVGATGVVYEGRMDSGATKVACKTYYTQFQSYVRTELSHVFTLNHVNLVQIMGIFEDAKLGPVLVMEYCPRQSIFDLFANKEMRDWYLENEQLNNANICLSVATGLMYLGNKDIVHGNLSPKNILVDIKEDQIFAKITDFWMGKYLSMPHSFSENYDSKRLSMAPSPLSSEFPIAPEITAYSSGQYSKRSDMYSFSFLVHYVYNVGDTPESKQDKELAMKGKPQNMPEEVYDFQQKCCSAGSYERPEVTSAVNFFHKIAQKEERLFEENQNTNYSKREEGAPLEGKQTLLINEIKKKHNQNIYSQFTDI